MDCATFPPGPRLWNGTNSALVAGRDVLELGAGAGLPLLVAGAGATEFPDVDLMGNLWRNIRTSWGWMGGGGGPRLALWGGSGCATTLKDYPQCGLVPPAPHPTDSVKLLEGNPPPV